MRILVAEQDATLLAEVAGSLRSLEHDVVECYSLPRLELALNRSPNGAVIVCSGTAPFGLALPESVPVVSFDFSSKAANLNTELRDLSGKVRTALRAAGGALSAGRRRTSFETVVFASSTGGFPAVLEILGRLRLEHSRVVVCQHIGADQSANLADRLNAHCGGDVVLVQGRTELRPGTVHLLEGGADWEFEVRPRGVFLTRMDVDTSYYHPSANRLLASLPRRQAAASCICVMSGLGDDGSRSLSRLKADGAFIMVQDPDAAIADGMPLAARATGAASAVLRTTQIADELSLKDL